MNMDNILQLDHPDDSSLRDLPASSSETTNGMPVRPFLGSSERVSSVRKRAIGRDKWPPRSSLLRNFTSKVTVRSRASITYRKSADFYRALLPGIRGSPELKNRTKTWDRDGLYSRCRCTGSMIHELRTRRHGWNNLCELIYARYKTRLIGEVVRDFLPLPPEFLIRQIRPSRGDDSRCDDAESQDAEMARRCGTEIDRRASARERIYENANNLLTRACDSCIYPLTKIHDRSWITGPGQIPVENTAAPSICGNVTPRSQTVRCSLVAASSLVHLPQFRVSRTALKTVNTSLAKKPINPVNNALRSCVTFSETTVRFTIARNWSDASIYENIRSRYFFESAWLVFFHVDTDN